MWYDRSIANTLYFIYLFCFLLDILRSVVFFLFLPSSLLVFFPSLFCLSIIFFSNGTANKQFDFPQCIAFLWMQCECHLCTCIYGTHTYIDMDFLVSILYHWMGHTCNRMWIHRKMLTVINSQYIHWSDIWASYNGFHKFFVLHPKLMKSKQCVNPRPFTRAS